MSTFTVIAEYFRTDTEVGGMETREYCSLKSAQWHARKTLRTFELRPNYVGECARIENIHGDVLCVYDMEDGKPVLRAPAVNP